MPQCSVFKVQKIYWGYGVWLYAKLLHTAGEFLSLRKVGAVCFTPLLYHILQNIANFLCVMLRMFTMKESIFYSLHHFRLGRMRKLHDDFTAVYHDDFTDSVFGFIHVQSTPGYTKIYRLIQTAAGSRSIVFSSSVILMTGALSSDGQPAQVSLSPLCGSWPAALPGQFAARCSRYVSVAVFTTFPAHETSWRTLRHGSPHRECICFALFNFQCSWGQ